MWGRAAGDSQLVHQVSAQVLSDMLVPGLPDPRGGEGAGGRQLAHATPYQRSVCQQLTGRGGRKGERGDTVEELRIGPEHTNQIMTVLGG